MQSPSCTPEALGPSKNVSTRLQLWDPTFPHYSNQDQESPNRSLHFVTAKEKEKRIRKAASTTKEVAKEKPNAQPSTRSRIGAHGLSTITKELHYVWNSMKVSANVDRTATTITDALFVLLTDAPACRTMQQRITKDPPDFRPLH